MFFNSWQGLYRTAIVSVFAYVILILFLRIFGKRTLAKMNAFDLVVTIALGSILATILLSKDVALAEGAIAILSLILLQYLVAWLSVRSRWFAGAVRSQPSLLFYKGQFLWGSMRKMRITEGEILSAIRARGMARLEDVLAVVLETDGSFTVLGNIGNGEASALKDVKKTDQ